MVVVSVTRYRGMEARTFTIAKFPIGTGLAEVIPKANVLVLILVSQ